MNKQEWLKRCAARYAEKADITQEQAVEFAQACYDNQYDHPMMEFSEIVGYNPEDCADEDMEEWVKYI